MNRTKILVLSVFTVLVAVAALFYYRLPSLYYEIPESYIGWVVVSYLQSNCQNSGDDFETLTIRVSKAGLGCSHRAITGNHIKTKWFVISDTKNRVGQISEVAWGTGKKGVWAHAILKRTKKVLLKEYFFIGTESELNSSWDGMPMPIFK